MSPRAAMPMLDQVLGQVNAARKAAGRPPIDAFAQMTGDDLLWAILHRCRPWSKHLRRRIEQARRAQASEVNERKI